jgi:vanillate O-demethylase monooxygenase subunit
MSWNPFLAKVFGEAAKFEGIADFVHLSDFYGPELVKTSLPAISKLADRDDVPKELGQMLILHALTPETEKTTHYFGFSTRNFRQGDADLDNFQLESELQVRQQDVDAINAVEARLDVAVTLQRELLVVADQPASKARRKIKAMLDLENTATIVR